MNSHPKWACFFEVKKGNEGPAILFKKQNWSHYITVTRDNGRDSDWKNLYIGVSKSYKSAGEDRTLLVFNYHVFPDRIQQTMNGGLMVLNGFLVKIGTPLVVTYPCKLVRSPIGLSTKLRK